MAETLDPATLFQVSVAESATGEATPEQNHKALMLLIGEVSKLTRLVQALVEKDIRKEEQYKRQEEYNAQALELIRELRKEMSILQKEVRDIQLKRAEEAKGVKVANNYWWVILLLGIAVTSQFTKGFTFFDK